jgi:hypothetical protein
MNNSHLFSRIKKLVTIERRIGVEILECLYEIEKRRAYAELKYDGLFSYCVRELGFTETQTYQRIQAMRAVKELPELKPMIESGSLSVSAVSKVQTHFKQESRLGQRMSKTEKLDFFKCIENKSSREVEVKIAEVKGLFITETLTIDLDAELSRLWKKVKNLSAHRSRGDHSVILRMLAESWLKKNDLTFNCLAHTDSKHAESKHTESTPAETEPHRFPADQSGESTNRSRGITKRRAISFPRKVEPSEPNPPRITRFIPLKSKREIWKRNQSQCTRRGSQYGLEIDHQIPLALNGGNKIENLRLLCKSCNRFEAERVFGEEKMNQFRKDA